MVTVAEAQRIAQQSRQRVTEQRRVITEVRQRLEQVRARKLTRAELQRRTRADIIKRKQQLKQFQQLKQSDISYGATHKIRLLGGRNISAHLFQIFKYLAGDNEE